MPESVKVPLLSTSIDPLVTKATDINGRGTNEHLVSSRPLTLVTSVSPCLSVASVTPEEYQTAAETVQVGGNDDDVINNEHSNAGSCLQSSVGVTKSGQDNGNYWYQVAVTRDVIGSKSNDGAGLITGTADGKPVSSEPGCPYPTASVFHTVPITVTSLTSQTASESAKDRPKRPDLNRWDSFNLPDSPLFHHLIELPQDSVILHHRRRRAAQLLQKTSLASAASMVLSESSDSDVDMSRTSRSRTDRLATNHQRSDGWKPQANDADSMSTESDDGFFYHSGSASDNEPDDARGPRSVGITSE